MSAESKQVIVACLTSEIEAFQRDIDRTGTKKDYFGGKLFDVREDWLAKLHRARIEVAAS